MGDISKELFKLFENYEKNFGECINKLRLMLDFASVSYKLSHIFISDGTFTQRIKKEVIAKSGEKAAKEII